MATATDRKALDSADKGGVFFRPRGRIIPAEEVQAWTTGQSYLAAAKREAERIRTETIAAVEEEKRLGFELGRKDGGEAVTRLLAETSAGADRYLAEADGRLIDLAMAIVQRVLGDFDERELIIKAVHHALAKQRKDQRLTLYAAPDIIDQLGHRIAESFDGDLLHLITIEADPKLEVDQCRVASEIGFIELGLEAQLNALHQGLRDGLKRPPRD